MTLIYILVGVLYHVGLACLGIFLYRTGKAKGKVEAEKEWSVKLYESKIEMAKKLYSSVDNINSNLNIRMQHPQVGDKENPEA